MAETDLATMLATLAVTRRPGEFVFVSMPAKPPLTVPVEATISEAEGVTWVVDRGWADANGLAYGFVGAWLTLEVFSALEAVGLTAAFSAALGAADIPANVIAGFHHDHIIVPVDRADDAMSCLAALRRASLPT